MMVKNGDLLLPMESKSAKKITPTKKKQKAI